MSEKGARSCVSKRRYKSERKAKEAAKATQRFYGESMKSYECDICKGWHVGAVEVRPLEYSRLKKEERYGNKESSY